MHLLQRMMMQDSTKYRQVTTAATVSASTPAAGSAAATVDGIYGANGFISNETGAGCVGVSFVAHNFGVPREIRKIDYWSYNSANDYDSTQNKLQYSLDGSTWVDHSILVLPAAGWGLGPYTWLLERTLRAPWWRIICNNTPNPGGNRWGVGELLMYVKE